MRFVEFTCTEDSLTRHAIRPEMVVRVGEDSDGGVFIVLSEDRDFICVDQTYEEVLAALRGGE